MGTSIPLSPSLKHTGNTQEMGQNNITAPVCNTYREHTKKNKIDFKYIVNNANQRQGRSNTPRPCIYIESGQVSVIKNTILYIF